MNRTLIRPIVGVRLSARVEQFALLAVALALVLCLPHTPDALAALGVVAGGVMGMYVDAQLVLSDAQAVTATAYSTNTFDSGLATNSVEIGNPLALCITVDVAAKTSATDETYQFALVQSANADLSSHDILLATDTGLVTRALLVKGFRFYLPIPAQLKTKRYLGARYITGGTGPTITVTTEIMSLAMAQNEKVFPANFTISS